jgi:hypothetical protein
VESNEANCKRKKKRELDPMLQLLDKLEHVEGDKKTNR